MPTVATNCAGRDNEAEGVCNAFAAALTSTSDAARGKGTSGVSAEQQVPLINSI